MANQWYYLSVLGETLAYYTITVTHESDALNQTTISYLRLSEDVPQEVTLEDDTPTYFRFHVNTTLQRVNVTVNLKPLKGKFDVYVKKANVNKEDDDNNNEESQKAAPPSAEDHQWKDVNNLI